MWLVVLCRSQVPVSPLFRFRSNGLLRMGDKECVALSFFSFGGCLDLLTRCPTKDTTTGTPTRTTTTTCFLPCSGPSPWSSVILSFRLQHATAERQEVELEQTSYASFQSVVYQPPALAPTAHTGLQDGAITERSRPKSSSAGRWACHRHGLPRQQPRHSSHDRSSPP